MPKTPISITCSECGQTKGRKELVRDLQKGGYKPYCRDCKPGGGRPMEFGTCATCGAIGQRSQLFTWQRKRADGTAGWSLDCRDCRKAARKPYVEPKRAYVPVKEQRAKADAKAIRTTSWASYDYPGMSRVRI